MAKKIVQPVEVQASVSGDQSVKSFKAQIREAQQEALRLAAAFGETDARTLAAAKRVAELKDRMEDVNATIQGLHPDKFQAIANITSKLASGFAAAQGAAALLGGESENLQKAMLRVQGAMALAQGIAGLKDLQFMFAAVKTTVLTEVIPALRTMGGALMATGVGAIIASIGAALVYFTNAASKARKEGEKIRSELQRANELYAEMNQRLAEEIQGPGIGEEIQILRDRLKGKFKTEEEANIARLKAASEFWRKQATLEKAGSDARLAYTTAAANADLEVTKLELQAKLKAQEDAAAKADKNREDQKAKLIKEEQDSLSRSIEMLKLESDTLDNRLSIARLNFEKQQRQLKEQGFTEVQIQLMLNAELKRVSDLYYKEQEDLAKAQAEKLKVQREKSAQDEISFIQSKYDEEELVAMKAAKTQEDLAKAQTEIRKRELQNEIQARRDAGLATVEQEKELEAMRLKNAEDAAAKQKEIDKEVARIKEQAYADVMSASTALIDLIGQQTAAGKAIALAQIAADTGVAIAKALNTTSSPSSDNLATGGLAGIAKFAAISAAILSASARAVKIVKGGNVQQGGGSPGIGGGRLPMPSMNSSSLGGGTQQAGQWNNKVYVTEGDISATQRRTRNLRKTSVL